MTTTKIVFVFLLCVPLLLLVSHFFGKLVDEILKNRQTPEGRTDGQEGRDERRRKKRRHSGRNGRRR